MINSELILKLMPRKFKETLFGEHIKAFFFNVARISENKYNFQLKFKGCTESYLRIISISSPQGLISVVRKSANEDLAKKINNPKAQTILHNEDQAAYEEYLYKSSIGITEISLDETGLAYGAVEIMKNENMYTSPLEFTCYKKNIKETVMINIKYYVNVPKYLNQYKYLKEVLPTI